MGLFCASDNGKNGDSHPTNYEEWINWKFGEGIAKHLMMPYAKKLWTVHPKDMNYEWVGNRVPRPKMEDVLDGALSDHSQRFGFNTENNPDGSWIRHVLPSPEDHFSMNTLTYRIKMAYWTKVNKGYLFDNIEFIAMQ